MTRVSTLFIAVTSWLVYGVSFAVLEPTAARADCAHWDIGGHWVITQKNGITVTVDLTQSGEQVHGTGSFVAGEGVPSGFPFGTEFKGGTQGSITGTIDKYNNILLNTEWGGVYRGGVGSDEIMRGNTFLASDPGNQVGWDSDWKATCQVVAEPSATTPPSHAEEPNKPVRRLGKRLPGTSTTSILPQKQVAEAKDDVDIYKGPGSEYGPYKCGELNCFMNAGETAPVLDFKDDWYKVKTNKVTDGSGWVAKDHLNITTIP